MQRFDNEKLRAMRIAKGKTLEAVCADISITKSALSLIETGATNPRLDTVLKLSSYFSKPVEFFLTSRETTVVPGRAA